MKRRWAIAIGLLAPLLASAGNVALPPQALGTSLQELAKQSGIQIIFFSKVVEGREAPALNGTFTPEAALDALLAGTNLTYRALNDRTIEVVARPQAAAVPWAPLPEPKPAPEASAAPDAPIAEVEITAERAELSEMRAEIARLENQFYVGYNQANTDRRYDIVLCRALKITGTHVDRRLCQPAALVAAPPKVPFLAFPVAIDEASVSIRTPTDPEELRAYQRNMVAVVREHPELLELVKQRNALVERYRLALQKKIEAREAHQAAARR
jgi:hypothetical protein